MPQNASIIATKTNGPEVHIFNHKNHPAKPPVGGKSNPDLRLTGHDLHGFGLSWCKLKEGVLLSGSYDSTLCLWDINHTPENKTMNALEKFKAHKGHIEDVAWHLKHDYLFASCGVDKYLHTYDFRSPCHTRPIQRLRAHQNEITCLSFNPYNEWLLASGSADTTVKSFDLRKFTSPLHTFDHHADAVNQIAWSPHNEAILASSCAGRRLMVWDTKRIGEEQSSKDAEDGPPELLFIHGGHTSRVADFSWNPTEDFLFATVSDDNILQVWQMADHIYPN